jgi:hypothetical protein
MYCRHHMGVGHLPSMVWVTYLVWVSTVPLDVIGGVFWLVERSAPVAKFFCYYKGGADSVVLCGRLRGL